MDAAVENNNARSGASQRTALVAAVVASGVALILGVVVDSRIAQLAVLAFIGFILTSMRVVKLKQFLLIVVLIEIPLQLDIYIGFDDTVAANNTVSGFNVSVTTACLVALYLLWGAETLALRTRRWSEVSWANVLPSIFYLGVVVVSSVLAINATYAWYEINLLSQAVLLFVYLLHYLRTRDDLLLVVNALLAGVLLQAAIVIWLNIGGPVKPIAPLLRGNHLSGRAAGTLGHPNSLGSYLTFLLPACLGARLIAGEARSGLLATGAFAAGMVALLLTASRGSWVGTTLALGFFIVVGIRERWLPRGALVALAVGASVLVVVAGQSILGRVAGFSDSAALARLPLNELALTVLRDNPILGVGANNFAEAMHSYLTVDYSRAWIATVHNKYLLVAAETGIVGLVAFLAFLATTVRAGWRAARAFGGALRPLAVGLLAGLLGAMVHMLFDIYHSRNQLQMLWMVAALILVVAKLGSRDIEHTSQGPPAIVPAVESHTP